MGLENFISSNKDWFDDMILAVDTFTDQMIESLNFIKEE